MAAITAGSLAAAGIAAAGTIGASAISSEMNNKAKSDRDKELAGEMFNPTQPGSLEAAAKGTAGSLAQQQAFVNTLQGQALTGTGPSVANQVLKNQVDTNNATASSMATSARGVNPGLAYKAALQQNAISNQQAGQTASAGRIQEQLNTQSMANSGLNAITQNTIAQQGQLLGAQGAYNDTLAGMANTQQKGQNAQSLALQNDLSKGIGGVANGAGGALTKMADGGVVPGSFVGRHMKMAHGGKVPALVSPGEKYITPKEVEKVAEGKKSAMAAGKTIPGEAKVKGAKNDYSNDTVSKTLDSGGIILPRSVTQAKDAPKKAAAFVEAILAKQGLQAKAKKK